MTTNKNICPNIESIEYSHYAKEDIDNVCEWFRNSTIYFKFKIENIYKFKSQIEEMESTLNEFPEDLQRIEDILINIMLKEEPIYAIFVDKSNNFILEGRHRIVAFSRLNITEIPVYYVLAIPN
jgi:hypothetical protein